MLADKRFEDRERSRSNQAAHSRIPDDAFMFTPCTTSLHTRFKYKHIFDIQS